MSRIALKVLAPVFLMALLSLAAVSTASAAVCPGGPGPTCIELRVENPPNPNNTPTFSDGATTQTWPTPGVPGCLPDVTPNWPGLLVNVDTTAPVAPPIQTCYNNFSLWASSGRDVGAMAGSQCINDLENVAFESPVGELFTSVSIELKCLGPATRLHDVQVYYYISPGVLCEQQLIEPPLYAAKPHGAPGVNSYILDTIPSDVTCAAGFRRIEIEPQIGSACSVVKLNDFRIAPLPFAATQVGPTLDVQGDLPDVTPDGPGALVTLDTTAPNAALICGSPDAQLSLTKSASPTNYSYPPGQVIVYTYVVKNTGDVTLSGPFDIADDKLGTFQCDTATSLAPGASITCTKSYTIQASDLNGTNNAFITNHAAATGKFETTTVTSNQAQVTINQVASTGKITVVKQAIPQAGGAAKQFDFTFSSPTIPFSLPGGGSWSSPLLRPDTYSVVESAPGSGWYQASATCSDQSVPNAIGLALDEEVVCTFVNQNDPATKLALTKANVAENKPVGTLVGYLSALDTYGDVVSFSLSPVDGTAATAGNNFFQVVKAGAQWKLLTKISFDYERQKAYSVVVLATDSANNVTKKQFIISILNVPDPN